jgi:ABC-type sulfate transport system substrate-binding protein
MLGGGALAFHRRQGTPKSGTDWRDLAVMLLAFPNLKTSRGAVRDRLEAAGADEAVLAAWDDVVLQVIHAEEDDDGES